mmetsp:Transcript_68854/g.162019  ORF Transcript_68854/g.162019 Transcript_68854/m.162019 type:complete len:110 (-) Transcript_68854:74-403(-)
MMPIVTKAGTIDVVMPFVSESGKANTSALSFIALKNSQKSRDLIDDWVRSVEAAAAPQEVAALLATACDRHGIPPCLGCSVDDIWQPHPVPLHHQPARKFVVMTPEVFQ